MLAHLKTINCWALG